MRDALVERLYNSPRAYSRESFDYDDFIGSGRIREFPRLINGHMTLADPKKHHKYIDHSVAPHHDLEIARHYLAWMLEEQSVGDRKNVGFSKRSASLLSVSPPRYFAGGVKGRDLAYVDMKASYFSLYAPATLDLHFDPSNMSFGVGRLEFLAQDWLQSEKTIRRAITGISTSTTIDVFKSGRSFREKKYNRFLAPGMWGYVMFNLHYMAREIIDSFGAHYWNTDGFIVDAELAEPAVNYLRKEWGAEFAVKGAGPGYVAGSASYRCGDYQTLCNAPTRKLTNLVPYNPALAKRLKYWRSWNLQRR